MKPGDLTMKLQKWSHQGSDCEAGRLGIDNPIFTEFLSERSVQQNAQFLMVSDRQIACSAEPADC